MGLLNSIFGRKQNKDPYTVIKAQANWLKDEQNLLNRFQDQLENLKKKNNEEELLIQDMIRKMGDIRKDEAALRNFLLVIRGQAAIESTRTSPRLSLVRGKVNLGKRSNGSEAQKFEENKGFVEHHEKFMMNEAKFEAFVRVFQQKLWSLQEVVVKLGMLKRKDVASEVNFLTIIQAVNADIDNIRKEAFSK